MWPQCGAGGAKTSSPAGWCAAPGDCLAAPEPVKIAASSTNSQGYFSGAGVDNAGAQSLYTTSRRAAASARGASAKPLTVYGERASGHDLVAMTGARGFGGSGVCRRRSRRVPGCLTGESEERETWTAESLRAASSNGEGFGFFRKRAAMEETSAVDVSGQHYDRLGEQSLRRSKWDLVKRCDLPGKSSHPT